MELLIENFAKIKYAKIQCNGITVIAGDNNTGKSTIGKVLCSIYNATTDLNEKINNERKSEIKDILNLNLRNLISHKSSTDFVERDKLPRLSEMITKQLFSSGETLQREKIIQNLRENLKIYNITDDEIISVVDKINNIVNVEDNKIVLEVISRYFSQVFSHQINNILDEESKASVKFNVKNQKMKFSFSNNICTDFTSEYDILYNAFYVDNPFIIDELNDFCITQNILKRNIVSSLSNNQEDIMDGIFDTISAKEKLVEVYKILENVVDGDIYKDSRGDYYLSSKKLKKPIFINNISTGLKSFVIIKMLLERGELKEKDVLILDEPEIHLHPQWQTYYAELIVLLQKYFNLTIIITTHSPYFLDAIEVFSAQHKISDSVNYYLSEIEDDYTVKVNDVTDNIEAIYKKLSDPMQQLENLRNRIENDVR